MDEKLLKIAAEFIEELKEAPPDDYLQIKLMLLSVVRHKAVDSFLHKIFQASHLINPVYRIIEPHIDRFELRKFP